MNEERTEGDRTRRFTSKPSALLLRGVMLNSLLLARLHDLRVLHRTLIAFCNHLKNHSSSYSKQVWIIIKTTNASKYAV